MDQVKGFTFYQPRTRTSRAKGGVLRFAFPKDTLASVSQVYWRGLAWEWAAQQGLGALWVRGEKRAHLNAFATSPPNHISLNPDTHSLVQAHLLWQGLLECRQGSVGVTGICLQGLHSVLQIGQLLVFIPKLFLQVFNLKIKITIFNARVIAHPGPRILKWTCLKKIDLRSRKLTALWGYTLT